MKQFIEYLVKAIVTTPDKVLVEEANVEGTHMYTITVDETDMGIVIGKQGKIIRSIRDLAKAKAIKDDVRIRIEINETRDA